MAADITSVVADLEANIRSVLLGKPEVVRMAVTALLAGGHVLIEDVPGVGKTLLARALARSIDGTFRRVQFTPDLLPSDVLGSSVFHAPTSEFQFHPGPIFTNVLLGDEINRTSPRTQSALLEAMNEGQVSVDGRTHALPRPFFVAATQNPFEFEGTYPLPENQLDRFLMRLEVGYPGREDEKLVLREHREGEPVEQLQPVLTAAQVLELQTAVRKVRVDDSLTDYMLDVVEETRSANDLHVGVSPRGTITWYRAAQSLAFVEGRDYVVPDDVKRLALPVLVHRVVSRGFLQDPGRESATRVVRRILGEVPVPT